MVIFCSFLEQSDEISYKRSILATLKITLEKIDRGPYKHHFQKFGQNVVLIGAHVFKRERIIFLGFCFF